MATYNKRGYKEPKPKAEKSAEEVVPEVLEVDEKNSSTATVFNALDETANKTETFVIKNQKAVIGVLVAVTIIAVGYFAYAKFVAEPKEDDAIEQMYVAQQNFQKAADGDVKSDSLYKLSIDGSEGKYGFVKIADEYSGTKTGNLANYYAGIAYLNTGNYDKAIQYLEKFDGKDKILKCLAIGAIGDAHSQKNSFKEALEFYVKASEANVNNFTTPLFLLKAGKTSLVLKNKADALKYFTEIKEKYDISPEAQGIDALIGLSQ